MLSCTFGNDKRSSLSVIASGLGIGGTLTPNEGGFEEATLSILLSLGVLNSGFYRTSKV